VNGTRPLLVLGCAWLVYGGCIAQEEQPRPVQAAVADLAGRLNLAAEQIVVVETERVTWPDASLGHPEPGKFYAQILVAGYKVILEANGTQYEYHTDMTNRAVYIGPLGVAAEADDGGEGDQPTPVAAAIEDLASCLAVAVAKIEVIRAEEVQWPNSALGWPEPGMMYTQALVPGYRVILGCDGRQFEYHTTATGPGRLGGMYFDPEATDPCLLAMLPAEAEDGNNRWDLHRMDLAGGEDRLFLSSISDFAATLDGRDLLVVRRLARSKQELLLVSAEGNQQPIAAGFEFALPSWSPLGHKYAVWMRAQLGAPWTLLVGHGADTEIVELSLERENWRPGRLVWSLDGFALTISTYTQWAPQAFFRDGDTVSELGDREVLAWIPATSSMLALRGVDQLVSLHLPNGHETELAKAPKMISAAPLGDRRLSVVSLRDHRDAPFLGTLGLSGGAPNELAINEGGGPRTLTDELQSLHAGPLGRICTGHYALDDVPQAVVLEVGERAEEAGVIRRLGECPKAVPVRAYASP